MAEEQRETVNMKEKMVSLGNSWKSRELSRLYLMQGPYKQGSLDSPCGKGPPYCSP